MDLREGIFGKKPAFFEEGKDLFRKTKKFT